MVVLRPKEIALFSSKKVLLLLVYPLCLSYKNRSCINQMNHQTPDWVCLPQLQLAQEFHKSSKSFCVVIVES